MNATAASPGGVSPADPRKRRRWKLVLVVLLGPASCLALTLFVVWKRHPTSPLSAESATEVADPRLTFPTRYRNVRPEVKYLGDQACQERRCRGLGGAG